MNLNLGTKNIILAAPHPGSTNILTNATITMAQEIGATVQIIDFQRVLSCLRTAPTSETKCNIFVNVVKLINSALPPLTKAFAPGQFEIQDDAFDDYDEDEEDGEEEEGANIYSSQSTSYRFPVPKQKPTTKIVLNLDFLKDQGTSTKAASIADLVLSNLSIVNSESEEIIMVKKTTPYDYALSDQEINNYLAYLLQSVKAKVDSGNAKSIILLLQDTTDVLESTLDDSGKRLFVGLMDLVNQLRQGGIPALLVAACSPSLADDRNLLKDNEFYTQMIDGSIPNIPRAGEAASNVALDGTLFDTSLDAMTDFFEKIEVLPPSPVYGGKVEDAGRKGKNQVKVQDKLRNYLEQLEADLKIRLAEMNCNHIEQSCANRKIRINLPNGEAVESGSDKVEGFDIVKSGLATNLWSSIQINKLINLALGLRLEQPGETENIEPRDLLAALRIMSETDISRFSNTEKPEKDGGSPAGGVWKAVDLPSKATPDIKVASVAEQDMEKVASDLKKRGIKLNSHEKRILSTVVNPENLKTTFSDLILPPQTKLVLQTLITLPLLKPEYFSSGILSRSSINGVLMFGPPGTGKTMLAKAVAKSSGAWFMSVALSDIFEKYVGEGEKNVRAIFTLARKLGGPCVIFLDEVDAVFGTRRSDGSGSSRREIMNEFMSEWDGLMSNNNGVVVLGATNRPFDLDDAILRRMPRRILIDLPTLEARTKIIESQLQGEELDPSINMAELAKRTANYSGSDLRNVCVTAALARVKESVLLEGADSNKVVDDWGAYLSTRENLEEKDFKLMALNSKHLDIGLAECPPSLSEEMQTLVELRKWDAQFGDGAAGRKGKKPAMIGFDLVT